MMRLLRVAALGAAFFCGAGAAAQGRLVDAVEYYHAGFDHYFVSSLAADIAALDSGALKGWARTGRGFKAWDAPAPGASPVCRFYIPPAAGDSHFYSASPAECAEVAAKFPSFSYESPAVMYVGLPDGATGACAGGWTPVYRLWNQRADSNHRYTTDRGVRDAMLAKGYVGEGYGPDGVAMCAPTAASGFEIAVAPAALTLMPGAARDVYVTVTPRGGFAGAVSWSVTGMPAGVAAQPAVATVDVASGPVSTVVRVTAAGTAAPTPTSAAVAVSGSAASGASAAATLVVAVAAAGDPAAARLAVIADVEQRARELSRDAPPAPAFLQAIAAYMASRTEYAESGVDAETQSVWGRFADGRLHIVAANRTPAPSTAGAAGAPVARDGAELPFSTKARLLHSFGTNFEGQGPIDEMRGYLTGKGWTVRAGAEGDAHVGTLKGVGGDGYFYINTHGGRGRVDDPKEPEGKIYSIQSSTLVDADYERVFDADLTALRLVHFTARNGGTITVAGIPITGDWDTRYAITYRFVERYMSFANESVVYINACYSSRDAAFVNAFLGKGAGVYLGWAETVSAASAYQSAPYFVDRMLGANQHPTQETPPQRAFPYDAVLQDMGKRGLATDQATGAQLQATAKAGLLFPPIFAPSIRYVAVDEMAQTLTLTGEFGQERPKVTVGGTEVAVNSWSATEIETTLPLTGPASSGDVVVTVRDVKSNARQLTEWSIPLKYQWTNAGDVTGWKFDGTGTLRLRADVGGYRMKPGDAPLYKARGGSPTRDSRLTITASGSHSDPTCTSKLSGTADYASPAQEGAPAYLLVSAFSVAGDTKQGKLGLALGFGESPHIATFSGANCPPPFPVPATLGLLEGPQNLPVDQSENPVMFPLPGFAFTLNAGFGVPPVSKTTKDAGGTLTVSWTGVVTKSPPRSTDDAGK
ncbi:MAG: hypothetical protein IT518_06540 [Burkholderiales bacterium]|nr:hypothetical protein [Burkholderiales bacterium]